MPFKRLVDWKYYVIFVLIMLCLQGSQLVFKSFHVITFTMLILLALMCFMYTIYYAYTAGLADGKSGKKIED